MIVTPSINEVCFFKGKFLLFWRDAQSFTIEISHPMKMQELTEENAATYGQCVFRVKKAAADIDLKPILQSERDMGLAQPLMLRDVQPKIEGGALVVYFESYLGSKGRVVLDDKLKPISMVVISDPVSK